MRDTPDKKRAAFQVRVSALMVTLLLVLTPAGVGAQSTAQINGRVTDQSGAVLPGVEVTATQTATGVTRTAVTDETGNYTLQSLQVGPYRLEAGLPGFRTFVQTGIVLQVNANPVINAVLEVGSVTETVEVQADAALVETRSTGIATLLDNQRVLELPLNGRQVTELVLLSSTATEVEGRVSHLNPGNRNYKTTVITVGGGLEVGLAYRLDGSYHNDPYNNLNLPLPFPDSLQEFKVETSGLQAQYGVHSSGAVNAVTKSGTNEFHGVAFEFLRNGSLNARNTFALENDGLKRNQFGGTIGGPVIHNKLFFFGGHQATVLRAQPSTSRQWVPTPQMIAGDFTTFASAACQGRNITLKDPFVNNRIDPARFSKAALNLVAHPLFPKTTDPCGEVRFTRPASEGEYVTIGKVDYTLSGKHSLFGRYLEARAHQSADFDGKNILTISSSLQEQTAHSLSFGDTYLIGPNMVNSMRGTWNRTVVTQTPSKTMTLTSLGVKGIYDPIPDYMRFIVTGGLGFSVPNGGSGGASLGHSGSPLTLEASDGVSMVKGVHQIGFGVDWLHRYNEASSGNSLGYGPTFNGDFTGLGLGDMMVGRIFTANQGNALTHESHQNSFGSYVQDTWKATSRLTVNAGLRWDPFISPYGPLRKYVYVDEKAFFAGTKSKVFNNAPPGAFYPGDPGIDKAYHNNRMLLFAPRLGFAWDVHGDGRMTVRSAYGLFYDVPQLYQYVTTGSNTPYGTRILNNSPGNLDDPWQGYLGGNPFPLKATADVAFPSFVGYTYYVRDYSPPYVHQWNLSLQRQLGTEWMVSANYVGSSTVHIPSDREVNYAVYIPGASTNGNTDQRRIFNLANPVEARPYGGVIEIGSSGTSHYNAMNLSIQRRQARGFTVSGNYTWSHCLGDDFLIQGATSAVATYPGRREFDRGNCRGDRRHNSNFSTVYETPQFASGVMRALASNWQISGIVRLQTGNVVLPLAGTNTALRSGRNGDRANQVLGDPYAANRNIDQWLNPAAYARPANGEWGNAPQVYSPGLIKIDMGVTRTFRITERQSVQFRAEAFNLPNHVNPGDPISAVNNALFGRILEAGDPRIMQLALKYQF
jgi:Carboxypeptidase regulatory-like domain